MKTNLLCFFLLIFLSTACLTSAKQDTSTAAARAYQTGMQALAQKDDRNAFVAFQRAVELDTSLAKAHYQLGVLHGKQSQWKPAIDALQTAIKLTPDFADAHVRLGEAYLIGIANAKDAVEPLQRALHLQPDLLRARRLLGDAYLRQNRIGDAIHQLKQAIEDSEARYLLGFAYFQTEDFTEAIPHFEAVIKRQKRHAKAHFNLGNCYLRTGKIAEGRAALRTFETLTREEEQQSTLQRLILDNPRHLQPRYQLAELHIKRTAWELASAELKACLAITPQDETASELLGYIYLQTEAYPEALEVYGHLVEAYPESAIYRNSLGIAYMMLKKPRQAIVQFETAIHFNTTNPQIYRNLANAYRQIGKQEKAEQAYQRYQSLTK
ncbi:MAG: tetratricopeptide repeat protein [Candidatus Poribacteria bacterium]|nr:tetratricopeptide repeat protein [Candidatus Poribacteria bacterium]